MPTEAQEEKKHVQKERTPNQMLNTGEQRGAWQRASGLQLGLMTLKSKHQKRNWEGTRFHAGGEALLMKGEGEGSLCCWRVCDPGD